MALLLCAVTGAWAATESSGNQGSKDTAIDGTSYSVAGASVAGTGGVKQGNMPDKGVKLRSTTPLVFSVKEGYAITKLEFWGCGNTSTAVTIVSATVDGGSNLLGSNVVLPGKDTSDAVKSGDIVLDGIYATDNITLSFATGSAAQIVGTWKITYETAAVTLAINTQPVSAVYATGATAEALTVSAKGGTAPYTYQWYSCDDAEKTNPSALAGQTASSYTPSTTATGYYFCKVTDSATPTPAEVESNVATITVSAASAPTKPVITGIPGAAVAKGAEVTLTASSTGLPEPTYEWFQCDNAEKANPVSKATTAAYSPSTAAAGTNYFYAVATNSQGSEESDVVTLVVNPSNECQLISVKFSNSAYGAITEPTTEPAANGTVTVPYMSGEDAPTVSTYEVSADAAYSIAGSTITVTAEDGVTTAEYDITTQAMTPLAVADDIATTTFDAVPAWIFNPYGYDSSKGVKFARAVNEASNMRISAGKTRQYYFIAAAKTLTLTSGTAAERDIKVYRNGTELGTPTKTAAKNNTIDIALDESAPCMIMIESNQTSGDGGFTKFAVEASTTNLTLTPAKTYTTLTSAKALDFTGKDLTAYIVKDTDASDGITLTKVNKVPAGTGLIIKATTPGAAVNVPILTGAPDDVTGNKMEGSASATTAIADNGGYILSNGKFHPASAGDLPAGKAYLKITVTSPAPEIIIEDGNNNGDDITTGIDTIEHSTLNIEHSEVYNLNGQRVSQPTKGLYIVNGKKVIVK